MSDASATSGAAGEAQRLEELEKATREYAEYSSQSFGLAGLVAVAVFGGNLVATCGGSPPWLPISRVLGCGAWLCALTLARRLYQRSGVVTSRAEAGRLARRWHLGVVYFAVAGAIYDLTRHLPRERDGIGYAFAYFAAVVMAPGLFAAASRVMHGLHDSAITTLLLVMPPSRPDLLDWGSWDVSQARRQAVHTVLAIGIVVVIVLPLVLASVHQHLAFRRLVRRLVLLKEPVP